MMPLFPAHPHVLPPLRMAPGGDPGGTAGRPLGGDDVERTPRGRRILVGEDEIIVAVDVEYTLDDFGAEVIGPAANLAEALSLVGDAQIDAAVLDVDLAGQDVFPVAERLATRGVPFLFHTGTASPRNCAPAFPAPRSA